MSNNHKEYPAILLKHLIKQHSHEIIITLVSHKRNINETAVNYILLIYLF